MHLRLSPRSTPAKPPEPQDSSRTRRQPVWLLAALVVGLVASVTMMVRTQPSDAAAAAAVGNVPPVQAVYHGIKPYKSFLVGTFDYDAWTYGDLVFYAPPGMVTQEMANQWLAWHAVTDDILRTLVGDDEDFESRYRLDDPNFGRKKVIATPPDSCGAGCGNKTQAEGVGIIDQMVAEPDNYENHWILFYEQARGGRDEIFDLSASWPRESYVLPHIVAALTYYEIEGFTGLQRGLPGSVYRGYQQWLTHDTSYVDQFIEREQRFFDDQYPSGDFIYPAHAGILLHLAITEGIDTLAAILDNLGQYPDNFKYENSTQAMCDFRAAVNDATDYRYDTISVTDWRLPANCLYDLGQNAGEFDDDFTFAVSGMCADSAFMPQVPIVGQFPCNGSAEQKVSLEPVEPVEDGRFLIKFTDTNQCVDINYVRFVLIWPCNGAPQQQWQQVGDTLRSVESGQCIVATPGNQWGGGLITLADCTGEPGQNIFGDMPVTPPTSPPTGLIFPLIHAESGKCVGQESATSESFNAALWNCDDNLSSLQYQLVRGDSGASFRLEHSGKCLDESGTNLGVWGCHGFLNQQFEWVGSQLRSIASGQCVTVPYGFLVNGDNVGIGPCTDTPNQHFIRPQLSGDADCDGFRTVLDALLIASFTANQRAGVTTCPLNLAAEVNTDQADLNSDGIADNFDARFILQCMIGIDNEHC